MAEAGIYVLLLYLPLDVTLPVGSLGEIDFPAGFYTYVDSVTSADGLTERLRHHLEPSGRPRRHIDHLQQVARVEEIWLSPGPLDRLEAWADLLVGIPGCTTIVEGFGRPSDEWDTQLFHFDLRPDLEDFALGVKKRFPDDLVLRAYLRPDSDDDEE